MVVCDNVITLKQYGGTCWFNALLTAIMYSDESRKLLLKKSKTWDLSIPIFNTIAFILKNKYFRTDDIYDDYKYFEDMTPEKILTLLNQYSPEKFKFNPLIMDGYFPEKYIQAVYNLLGVNILFLDYNRYKNKYYYSRYNTFYEEIVDGRLDETFNINATKEEIQEKINKHDIIIINNSNLETDKYFYDKKAYSRPHYLIDYIKDEIDIITFKNQKYNQDSVILTNHNTSEGLAHSIAGIKCKGVKHVYNGWTRTTIDPAMGKKIIAKKEKIEIPCEYMKFNWKTDAKRDFKLDRNKCNLAPTNKDDLKNDLVFSFNSGDRMIIYTKVIPSKPPIIIPDQLDKPPVFIDVPIPLALPSGLSVGKVSTLQAVIRRKLAPKLPTNEAKTLQAIIRRKIMKKPEPTPVKPVPIKPPKICPEGSVLNPITNRCNKIKIPKIPK